METNAIDQHRHPLSSPVWEDALVKQHIKWLATPQKDLCKSLRIRMRPRVWFSSWLAADVVSLLFNHNILRDDDDNDDDNDRLLLPCFYNKLWELMWF